MKALLEPSMAAKFMLLTLIMRPLSYVCLAQVIVLEINLVESVSSNGDSQILECYGFLSNYSTSAGLDVQNATTTELVPPV